SPRCPGCPGRGRLRAQLPDPREAGHRRRRPRRDPGAGCRRAHRGAGGNRAGPDTLPPREEALARRTGRAQGAAGWRAVGPASPAALGPLPQATAPPQGLQPPGTALSASGSSPSRRAAPAAELVRSALSAKVTLEGMQVNFKQFLSFAAKVTVAHVVSYFVVG